MLSLLLAAYRNVCITRHLSIVTTTIDITTDVNTNNRNTSLRFGFSTCLSNKVDSA